MMVVVVLAWRRLRPPRLQSPNPASPMLQVHVLSVSCGCCKSRSGCCICCNDCTHILQVPVLMFLLFFQTYVVSVFIWMLHMFCTYVASILSECCIYLQLFFKCFPCVFASVSDACFEYFNYFVRMLQVFHLDILKVDQSVVHVAVWATCCSSLLQLLGRRAWRGAA
jgi:hypothetical protein